MMAYYLPQEADIVELRTSVEYTKAFDRNEVLLHIGNSCLYLPEAEVHSLIKLLTRSLDDLALENSIAATGDPSANVGTYPDPGDDNE